MIQSNSMVREKDSGRLGFVCDLDEDVIGGLTDPSCVRAIKLFDSGSPRDEWECHECFLDQLAEVVEAKGARRSLVCSDFEYLIIENFWTEDTPLEERLALRIMMKSEVASIYFERGFAGPVGLIGRLDPYKVGVLHEAFDRARICEWRHFYDCKDWHIGGNEWLFTFIRGVEKVTTGGEDNYHAGLEPLCNALRGIGLPVRFWNGHGLAIASSRKMRKPKRLSESC